MTIDYYRLKDWRLPERERSYSDRDTMLYALAVGLGAEPLDRSRLHFVYERDLRALPTMATVLAYPGFWMKDPATGIDWVKTLDAGQNLTLHRPLPASGTVVCRNRISRIIDKGSHRGALIVVSGTVTDKAGGTLLATVEQINHCADEGGYSAGGQPSDDSPAEPPQLPKTPPDAVCDLTTRPETALLYRLTGDVNPLHADPEVARAAGFRRPIMHGLATFGVAGHAVLRTCCGYDPDRLGSLSARFTAPAYPGDTIRTEMWTAEGRVLFRAHALERNVVVLDSGYADIP